MSIGRRPHINISDGGMVVRVRFDPGAGVGNFDDATENAVRLFQRAKGLVDDGIVGQRTWSALGLAGQVPHPVVLD